MKNAILMSFELDKELFVSKARIYLLKFYLCEVRHYSGPVYGQYGKTNKQTKCSEGMIMLTIKHAQIRMVF